MSAVRYDEIYDRALKMWRERENELPPRVRRMAPDDMDRASGAWGRCLSMAALELGWKPGDPVVDGEQVRER